MNAESAAVSGDSPGLRRGALGWRQVAVLGIAIAISGNTAGWNYGLAIGGWGGMLLAATAMLVLFLCLTQTLAELAVALPTAGGFDGFVQRAFGGTAAYLAGMSVAVALSVGAGLAVSFTEAYLSGWTGIHGWSVKLLIVIAVLMLQLRGAEEAVGLTAVVGVVAVLILIGFCAYMAPAFDLTRLYSQVGPGERSLLPHGMSGAAGCIPFALFLFLGVEQAAHAASEMRDVQRSIPKALATAIFAVFVIGFCVLLIATGAAGADRLSTVADPLITALAAQSTRPGALLMTRAVGAGVVIAIVGTFFSLAYAGSRQFYHLALAGLLPRRLGRVNRRQAPAPALALVTLIALVSASLPPNGTMVVFIFMISVSHALLLAAFIRLRIREPLLERPYRAIGGPIAAWIALGLSLSVMASCYRLQPRALSVALAVTALLVIQFKGSRRLAVNH